MDLSSILTSRTVAWIGFVCIVLSALAALWAMVKLSYQRALGKPMPRNALTATLDVLAELAVNVVGAVSRVLKLGTGEGLFRPTVPLAPGEALPLSVVAEKQGALDVSATRPSVAPADHDAPPDEDAHASIVPPAPSTPTPAHGVAHIAQAFAPVFDPSERQTIAPEVVARVSREGERGSVDVGTLVYAGSMLAFVLAMGLGILGCPAVREAALRVTPGVPDPLDCEPLAQRCDHGVPVVCSPVPVPGTNRHREWPSLPRAGNGSQRACAHGCTVDADGGAAHCIDADASADGGAL